METHATIPAIRPLELVAVQHEGRDLFLLRDPRAIATETVLLSEASVELLRFFDGAHSVREVQAELTRRTGQIVPLAQLEEFVAKLDGHYFLESPAYRERRRRITEEYAALSERSAQFAGSAYAEDPATLWQELTETYRVEGGPGVPEAPPTQPPAAIIAPHIDPARGAASYAHAYTALWGTAPKRIIILGICHAGGDEPFILTTKDYATPLGVMQTDRELISTLCDQLAWDPLASEELHRSEHSIEFQVIYLQHALSRGGTEELPENLVIVPILCAFPWQVFLKGPESEAFRAQVDGFLKALGGWVDDETLIVAGIDLAHVGRRFGDPAALSEGFMERLQKRDQATLSLLAKGDREGFLAQIIAEQDERRICGFSACYGLLTLLPGKHGEVLDYGQHLDRDAAGAVTFGAVRFQK